MTRVVVVEDAAPLRDDLVEYLSGRGFAATGAATAAALRAILDAGAPDVIILDIGLPDGNGFELAREIRLARGLACGIVVLTAFGDPDHRVEGLDSGADAYLVKHASLREIEATLRSVLRRLGRPPGGDEAWQLSRADWLLQAPGRAAVRLTGAEMAFVEALVAHAGETCSRAALAEALARPATAAGERNLDTLVRRLRRKIAAETGVDAPIKAVYGAGYVFTGAVRVVDGA